VWPLNNNNLVFVLQPSLANNGRLASTLAIVSGFSKFISFAKLVAYTLGE
jgi:hypothetical protein